MDQGAWGPRPVTVARFPVTGQLDCAGGRQPGTVTIDRETNMFAVRPRGRRRTYELDLGTVATMVTRAIILMEHREKRIATKKAKKAGRG